VLSAGRAYITAATASLCLLGLFGLSGSAVAKSSHSPPGELLAYKILSAKSGGTVAAPDGAAIKIPGGVMQHNSLVTITHMRSGRYDMNIAGPWKGRVAVTLPAQKRDRGIIHLIGSTWVQEGKPGQRTVWVRQLSLFSWAGDKLKAAACFTTIDFRAVITCLAQKGLSKIDSGLVKWLADKAGVNNECALQLIASKGIVSSLFNALTGACVEHAGLGDAEKGAGIFPSPPAPDPAPAAPSQPSPGVPSPPPPPSGVAETTGGPTHTWTNYTNAGGYEGPTIAAYTTVLISCKLTGFRVADGNTWWYRIGSAPWNNSYYASADAFYNNGQTSGSLKGTPFVDPAIPDC